MRALKIPGLKRKEYKIKNTISKELDQVVEQQELDNSPKKTPVEQSFAQEHLKLSFAQEHTNF